MLSCVVFYTLSPTFHYSLLLIFDVNFQFKIIMMYGFLLINFRSDEKISEDNLVIIVKASLGQR